MFSFSKLNNFKQIILLFTLLALVSTGIKVYAQKANDKAANDTIYLLDYFGITYNEIQFPVYQNIHGISYRGRTTIYIPGEDSVVLQTKLINRMPEEIDQYAMLRIIKPKDIPLMLYVKFEKINRRGKTTATCYTMLELKKLKREYSFFFGKVHDRKRRLKNGSIDDCGLQIINSDSINNFFYKQIIKGNIEKGVTHIYNAVTGELIENPVFYN